MTQPTPQANFIRQYTAASAGVIASLGQQASLIEQLGQTVITAFQSGRKILAAGNGGSAAEAMHLCEELTGKYFKVRKALPALCLNADPTALTCIGNDWDFASVFSRQIEAFAKPGDIFIGISTSGNSENILRAFTAAKIAGAISIGLFGKTGGKAKAVCDLPFLVDSLQGSHVQEAHQALIHLLLEQIDSTFAP